MDQFTEDLRRELRAAALREEARAARPWHDRIAVPALPRLAAPGFALVALLALVLVVGGAVLRGGGEGETDIAAPALTLPTGTLEAAVFPPDRPQDVIRYELILREGRYELRANGELERSGTMTTTDDVVTFGLEGQCGPDRGRSDGSYRFARRGDEVTFRVIDDPCEARASVLTSPTWVLGG